MSTDLKDIQNDRYDVALPPGKARDVFFELQNAILHRKLKPGTKLSEDEVGDYFGASRTTVRIALQVLAQSGLITIERNRGAFVAEPSVQEAREVFDARAKIEPLVAELAAQNMTQEGLELLRKHIEEEHEAIHEGDMGRALYLSGMFHVTIAGLAQQNVLASFVRTLIARSSLIIALYWVRQETTCESHAHDALLKAFQERDGAAASDIMKSHMIDLFSGLDLREQKDKEKSLAEILRGK